MATPNRRDLLLVKKNSIRMMEKRDYKIPKDDRKYKYEDEVAYVEKKEVSITQELSQIYYPLGWPYDEFELFRKDTKGAKPIKRKEGHKSDFIDMKSVERGLTLIYFFPIIVTKNIDTKAWETFLTFVRDKQQENLESIQSINKKNGEIKLDKINFNVIMIANKPLTAAIEEEAKNLEASVLLTRMRIEQLKIDPLNNWLVSKHEVCSEKEKNQLMKDFSVGPKQLPRILKTDPQSSYMNFNRGDLIKVKRQDYNIGITHIEKKSTYWRIVT